MSQQNTAYPNLVLLPQNVDFVIYHGKCSDGFGSALCAYLFFKPTDGLNSSKTKVEYYPASFNVKPPNVKGKNVLMCDFTYNADDTKQILKDANSVAIIDHHKSAELNLKNVDDKYKIFKMDHSGAYLTWKYFFPEQEVPLLIKYIEDNDIWLKKMPNTQEITSYIFVLPFEFEEYEKLYEKLKDSSTVEKEIMPVAQGMKKQNDYYVKQAIEYGNIKFVNISGNYYIVVYLNTTVLKSEIGNSLLKKYPLCDFAAVYSTDGTYTSFSLRSDDTKADVSQIASKFGGGGHRNAAGMSVFNSVELPVQHLDNIKLYDLLKNIYFDTLKVDDVDNVNIVYLNAQYNKKHIGKYLLQKKYIDKSGTPVQQCSTILENQSQFCDVSCVWCYDGAQNKTWFSVHLSKSFIMLYFLVKNNIGFVGNKESMQKIRNLSLTDYETKNFSDICDDLLDKNIINNKAIFNPTFDPKLYTNDAIYTTVFSSMNDFKYNESENRVVFTKYGFCNKL